MPSERIADEKDWWFYYDVRFNYICKYAYRDLDRIKIGLFFAKDECAIHEVLMHFQSFPQMYHFGYSSNFKILEITKK